MNCQPGDIAMFVWLQPPLSELSGVVIQLGREAPAVKDGYVLWSLEEPYDFVARAGGYDGRGNTWMAGEKLRIDKVGDELLRPIRWNAGTDEMLCLLGLPPLSKQREAELREELGMQGEHGKPRWPL